MKDELDDEDWAYFIAPHCRTWPHEEVKHLSHAARMCKCSCHVIAAAKNAKEA